MAVLRLDRLDGLDSLVDDVSDDNDEGLDSLVDDDELLLDVLDELVLEVLDDVDELDVELVSDDRLETLETLDTLETLVRSESVDVEELDVLLLELELSLVAELTDVTLLPDVTPELKDEDSSSHSAASKAHLPSSG